MKPYPICIHECKPNVEIKNGTLIWKPDDEIMSIIRKARRYHISNQKTYIEERQIIQWPKEKGQKKHHLSTKILHRKLKSEKYKSHK